MGFRNAVAVLSSTALLVALVLVVVLAQENRSLRADLMRARLQAHLPPVGFTVPAFDAVTLSGDSVIVGRASHSQVLFFFATTCEFCRQTLPAWDRIAARAPGATSPFTVLGLSQNSDSALRAFAAQHGIAFDVIRFPDSTYPLLYRAEAVPLTVVVDSAGRVLRRRGGVLTRAGVDSIVRVARGRVPTEAPGILHRRSLCSSSAAESSVSDGRSSWARPSPSVLGKHWRRHGWSPVRTACPGSQTASSAASIGSSNTGCAHGPAAIASAGEARGDRSPRSQTPPRRVHRRAAGSRDRHQPVERTSRDRP